jgi:prepilin-type N-terminal cleavage/methylation domain-containing protein
MIMLKRNGGFTLVEVLIVMVLLVGVLAIASDSFRTVVRASSTQTRIAETQMETNIGLQMLKADIEGAGLGLPWAFQRSINYNEVASSQPAGYSVYGSIYNDSTGNVPRAFICGDSVGFNGSDYIAIKSVLSIGNPSQRWSYVQADLTSKGWASGDISGRLAATDQVVVIRPQASENTFRRLVMSTTAAFSDSFSGINSAGSLQVQSGDIIYGINASALRMPFNRTDYYVNRPATMPALCAPNTGVLYKATVNHSDGNYTLYPVLDCVVAMRVIIGLDMNQNGIVDTHATGLSGTGVGGSVGNVRDSGLETIGLGASTSQVQAVLTDPALLRNQLKEVRIYILAHEGRRDPDYTYPGASNPVPLGEFTGGFTKSVNLATVVGTDWSHYRWKVYRIVVKTNNL